MKRVSDKDRVSEGDIVRVFYDDLQGLEGIVRRVMDRNEGTLSIRIPSYRLSIDQIRNNMIEDGMVCIVVTDGEWEWIRRMHT